MYFISGMNKYKNAWFLAKDYIQFVNVVDLIKYYFHTMFSNNLTVSVDIT